MTVRHAVTVAATSALPAAALALWRTGLHPAGSLWQTGYMGLWDLVRAEHVLAAVQENEEIGQATFLDKYHFGPSRSYQLLIEGRSYDSKAILGAAHGHATGSPLSSRDFSGGSGYSGAASVLQRLGFEVAKMGDLPVGLRQVDTSTSDVTEPERAPLSAVHASADLVLIGCVKTKQSTPARARELYTSPLFVKRRRYAEGSGRPWYILSALYGLVDPDQVLEPYDMHLAKQSAAYRRHWAAQVVRDLTAMLELFRAAPSRFTPAPRTLLRCSRYWPARARNCVCRCEASPRASTWPGTGKVCHRR